MKSAAKQGSSSAQRMRQRRARLRAAGYRPIQFWVPDLRKPEVREALRREAAMLSTHPENAALDEWLDAVTDWD
ncbi:MAG TPA: antitoxin MazE family protein [Hyphomicrobiales bacterium]|nr:antitoxin MazE family protein [Hyphomicrobiales bacterium]